MQERMSGAKCAALVRLGQQLEAGSQTANRIGCRFSEQITLLTVCPYLFKL